jgi:hypothetical protein
MLKEPPREWLSLASKVLANEEVQSLTVMFAESFRFERGIEDINVTDKAGHYHLTARRFDGKETVGRDPDFSTAAAKLRVKLSEGVVEEDDA